VREGHEARAARVHPRRRRRPHQVAVEAPPARATHGIETRQSALRSQLSVAAGAQRVVAILGILADCFLVSSFKHSVSCAKCQLPCRLYQATDNRFTVIVGYRKCIVLPAPRDLGPVTRPHEFLLNRGRSPADPVDVSGTRGRRRNGKRRPTSGRLFCVSPASCNVRPTLRVEL